MAETVVCWVEYQTRRDMDNGTWPPPSFSFSSVAKAMERAEYLRKAYVNVRIRSEYTRVEIEPYD